MSSHQSFLHVSSVPNPLLHGFSSEEGGSFLNELVSTHLNVLIEQVASQNLLAIFSIKHVGSEEHLNCEHLGDECEVLVLEEHVVVVKHSESKHTLEDHEFFVEWVIDI